MRLSSESRTSDEPHDSADGSSAWDDQSRCLLTFDCAARVQRTRGTGALHHLTAQYVLG